MAMEYRGGRQYYYRKRREGGRVISEYVGGGFLAELAEASDTEDRWKAEQKRREIQQAEVTAAGMNSQLDDIGEFTQTFTKACLLLAGYHAPKRQWRKRRDG